ncbi:interleukin-17 receptor C [Sinocyclocheilus rhinocerous]|uniref:Interleukin-17 receptor C-like n=2 Tax=Sinocyclocheilus rhinocerous TaxID=307959 RepID=A0A673M5S2_9TELE|nr:PREDICTED: interleukin-17 receptor C-like [Sinocyclocheilus rhinocerous]
MYSSSLIAHVVLLCVLFECSLSVRESLRVRQERSGAERRLPALRLSTLHLQDLCVRVRLSVRPLLANETLMIELSDSETGDSDTLLMRIQSNTVRWISSSGDQPHTAKIQMRELTSHQAFWTVRYDCFPAQPGSTVSVSVHIHSHELISAYYVVEHTDPVPKASVTVDEHAKRFTVRMQTDQRVKMSLCYKRSHAECSEIIHLHETDPTVNLSFPYLVPCVCVQLWFPGSDSRRNTQCPLKERALPRGDDILSSSSATVLGSVLCWEPLCPADQSDPSVSLCWRIHTQNSYCVPAPNASLHGMKLQYNVSAVDRHPQMCVKFSLNGSRRVFCPFGSEDLSEWSVTVVPGSLHLHLHLRSSVAASFAAQLCARQGETCSSQGSIISQRVDGGATEAELSVPFPFLSSGLCVQVWRLDLRGRRIICPDFTHRRWGLITGTSLALLAAVTVLVCITCYLVKRSISVWRSGKRRPVLLVCSSDHAAHIAAICSLASGLQGKLFMDVRLAQWASSVAQLGPVPWLYGQCQAVQKAGGLVLIAWSPDAHQAFLRRVKSNRVAGSEFSETGLYSAVEEEEQKSCDGEWMEKPVESSSITAPVFNAALSCLWTGLHSDGHARGFGLVCFQGLNNNNSSSTYIPKQLRCVPKYCLPKDLSSLIHNLGEPTRAHGSGRCWPRLLSKALSFFMSRQLAPRLEAGLPGPGFPKSSRKSVRGTKWKTWRQKKRRSKVVSACLSRKECSKKHTAPELLGAAHTSLKS